MVTHPLDNLSGDDALRAVGFAQRRPAERSRTPRGPYDREIYRVSDGAVIGTMNAHEARVLAEQEFDAQRGRAVPA